MIHLKYRVNKISIFKYTYLIITITTTTFVIKNIASLACEFKLIISLRYFFFIHGYKGIMEYYINSQGSLIIKKYLLKSINSNMITHVIHKYKHGLMWHK